MTEKQQQDDVRLLESADLIDYLFRLSRTLNLIALAIQTGQLQLKWQGPELSPVVDDNETWH